MKYFCLLAILAACIVTSCHDAPQQNNSTISKDSTPTRENADTASTSLSEREKLIRALQQLQQAIASHNKEAIAACFSFPVESDSFQVFDVNAAFDKQLAQDKNLITRQLFLTHFNALYDNLEMAGFAGLFSHLQLVKLKDTATKQVEASLPAGVCTHFYSITLAGNKVTLQYGTNTNEAYISKQQEDPVECPEYAAFWTFVFDGEKLLFSSHQAAG